MVDALRRVHAMVTPDGRVIDVHPTAVPAALVVGSEPIGLLDVGDAPQRHAAAGAALATAIDRGLFDVLTAIDFRFHTDGDSVEELRDHVAAHWRTTRIGVALAAAGRRALDAAPAGLRPRVVEEVRLTVLRPIADRR
jgi:hypothetical protein